MSCQLYFDIINFQCKQNVHNSKSHIIIIRGQRMKEIFQLYLNIWCSYVTTSGNQQTGAWWISFGHISHYPSTPVLKCVAAIKCLANICNEMVKCLNLNIWYVLHLLLWIKCRFVWFYLHFFAVSQLFWNCSCRLNLRNGNKFCVFCDRLLVTKWPEIQFQIDSLLSCLLGVDTTLVYPLRRLFVLDWFLGQC